MHERDRVKAVYRPIIGRDLLSLNFVGYPFHRRFEKWSHPEELEEIRTLRQTSQGVSGNAPSRYCSMSWCYPTKLFEHCAEIDETARNRMELIVRSLAEQNGVTEQLKAENQMEWVRQMNACKAQAEEIVKVELIYD